MLWKPTDLKGASISKADSVISTLHCSRTSLTTSAAVIDPYSLPPGTDFLSNRIGFEQGLPILRSNHGELVRYEVVPRIPWADFQDLVAESQLVDVFLEDDLQLPVRFLRESSRGYGSRRPSLHPPGLPIDIQGHREASKEAARASHVASSRRRTGRSPSTGMGPPGRRYPYPLRFGTGFARVDVEVPLAWFLLTAFCPGPNPIRDPVLPRPRKTSDRKGPVSGSKGRP
eukprot:scaffold363_cov331-Pavlova_lutheri.AAC.80